MCIRHVGRSSKTRDGRVRAGRRFLGRAQSGEGRRFPASRMRPDDLPSVRGRCPCARSARQSAQHNERYRLTHLALLDSVWWVRRTATVALAPDWPGECHIPTHQSSAR